MVIQEERRKWLLGSCYYDAVMRRNGWGRFFGAGVTHAYDGWELWCALFGRTFWFGRIIQ